jgi:hypothetical protein
LAYIVLPVLPPSSEIAPFSCFPIGTSEVNDTTRDETRGTEKDAIGTKDEVLTPHGAEGTIPEASCEVADLAAEGSQSVQATEDVCVAEGASVAEIASVSEAAGAEVSASGPATVPKSRGRRRSSNVINQPQSISGVQPTDVHANDVCEDAQFQCCTCKKSFRKQSLLDYHIKYHHVATASVTANRVARGSVRRRSSSSLTAGITPNRRSVGRRNSTRMFIRRLLMLLSLFPLIISCTGKFFFLCFILSTVKRLSILHHCLSQFRVQLTCY